MITTSKSPGLILALAAILIWSTMALISTRLTHISSFLILGVAFLISGSVSLIRRNAWNIPLTSLLVGVAGIFGYHFLYFRAFTLAPAVEANLINYLWPLLIVVFSPIVLPNYHLKKRHIIAAILGLTGASLIVTEGRLNIDFAYLSGYLLALSAAVTWAIYSLLTKRLPSFSTDSVAAFCFISGILSLICFILTGGTIAEILSINSMDWIFIILAGIGPLGTAFYCWDAAFKRGDPRTIGLLAYLTPMLSTLNLLIFGGKTLSIISLIAMVLIIGGAMLGSIANSRT